MVLRAYVRVFDDLTSLYDFRQMTEVFSLYIISQLYAVRCEKATKNPEQTRKVMVQKDY